MNTVATKNAKFFIVLGSILLVLAVLFLVFGHFKHEREGDIARNSGNDDQSRLIRNEAEQYRIANRNTQLSILVVGGAVISVAMVWWAIGKNKGQSQLILPAAKN